MKINVWIDLYRQLCLLQLHQKVKCYKLQYHNDSHQNFHHDCSENFASLSGEKIKNLEKLEKLTPTSWQLFTGITSCVCNWFTGHFIDTPTSTRIAVALHWPESTIISADRLDVAVY